MQVGESMSDDLYSSLARALCLARRLQRMIGCCMRCAIVGWGQTLVLMRRGGCFFLCWCFTLKARGEAATIRTLGKSGRVVDCTGLENRRWATIREFESHLFRQFFSELSRRLFEGVSGADSIAAMAIHWVTSSPTNSAKLPAMTGVSRPLWRATRIALFAVLIFLHSSVMLGSMDSALSSRCIVVCICQLLYFR